MNIIHNIHDLFAIHHIQYNLDDVKYFTEHYSFLINNYTNKNIEIIHHGHGKIYQGPIYSSKILFYVTEDKYGTIYSLHNITKDCDSDKQIEYLMIVIPDKMYGDHIDIIKIGGKNNYITKGGYFKDRDNVMYDVAKEIIDNSKKYHKLDKIRIDENMIESCESGYLDGCMLYVLLYGNTFYGSLGFVPIDDANEISDIDGICKRNKEIYNMNNKISDIKNIEQYVGDYLKEKKDENGRIANILNDMTVPIDILIKILLNNKCYDFVAYIHEKIFNDLGYVNVTKNRLSCLDTRDEPFKYFIDTGALRFSKK